LHSSEKCPIVSARPNYISCTGPSGIKIDLRRNFRLFATQFICLLTLFLACPIQAAEIKITTDTTYQSPKKSVMH